MFGLIILRNDKKTQNTSVYICITFNYLIFARKMKCQTVEKHVENVNNFFTKVRKMSYFDKFEIGRNLIIRGVSAFELHSNL